MQRILIVIASLTVLAASPVSALQNEKKDDSITAKPPVELRIDQASPGLHDTLTSEPATADESATAIQAISTAASEASGNWLPPS